MAMMIRETIYSTDDNSMEWSDDPPNIAQKIEGIA